jgi:hypothetical protein
MGGGGVLADGLFSGLAAESPEHGGRDPEAEESGGDETTDDDNCNRIEDLLSGPSTVTHGARARGLSGG